ncbi:amidase [Spirochaeta lutea]|uniref:amidase n=1 Tax=Spirochaeta lutea TaxID=1480694 RepID=UPI00068E5B27|nr:amidase [Spirochaeta lutea]
MITQNTMHTTLQALKEQRITCQELTATCFQQIETVNPAINSIVTLNYREAMAAAKISDERIKKGNPRLLEGIPITIKDHFATKNLRTTNSMKSFAQQVPDFDATVVARLRKEGAVILGKTNLPFMAMDFQANSPIFGVTNNPWDVTRTSGGSTAGAAAVASNMSFLEVGSDLAGSIRIPAHFCGVYGLRPTDYAVSRYGLHPGGPKTGFRPPRNMAVPGLVARSLEDLTLGVSIISGPDAFQPELGYLLPPEQSKLKFLWTDSWPGIEVDDGYKRSIRDFIRRCEHTGITMVQVSELPMDVFECYKVFGALLSLELMNLPLFLRMLVKLQNKRVNGFSLMNTQVSTSRKTFDTWMIKRESLMARLEAFLAEYDGFICPVTATAAPKHLDPGKSPTLLHDPMKIVTMNGNSVLYGQAMAGFTVPFSVTGSPVVSLPIGLVEERLPVGVQVVGRRFHDLSLLQACNELERHTGSTMPIMEKFFG